MAIRKNTKTARMADDYLRSLWNRPISECPTDANGVSILIAEETGNYYSPEELLYLATWTRKNADHLGWVIPNMEVGASGNRRWIVVVNGTQLSHDEVEAVETGYRASARHALSRARNSITVLNIAIANAPKSRTFMLKTAVQVGSMYITLLERALAQWEEDFEPKAQQDVLL